MISGDAWKCQVCGKGFVVQGLARDCERRHRHEAVALEMLRAGGDPTPILVSVPEPVWPKLWNLAHAAEELAVIEAAMVALARIATGKRG